MWLVLLAMVGLHLRATARRVRLPHPRIANPPEGLLAGLVSAVVVAAATAGSRGGVPAPPPVAVDAPGPPTGGQDMAAAPGSQADTPAHARADPAAGPAAPAGPVVASSGPGHMTPAAADFTGAVAAGDASTYQARSPVRAAGVTGGGWRQQTVGDGPRTDRDGDGAGERGGAAGVVLPGGWLDRGSAEAVSAVVGLWWLRRRRRYLPGPPCGAERVDADLAPPPPTAAAVVTGLYGDLDDVGASDLPAGGVPGVPAEPTATAADVGVGAATAAGVGRGGPLRPVDLPVGGVGLVGPGAADAVRGVMTAVLLAAGAARPGRDTRVWTTAADLAGLLEADRVGAARPPGLGVYRGVEQLLAAAETYLLRRGRAAAAPHPTAGPAGRAGESSQPSVLLVTAAPTDPALARRLAVLLTHTGGPPGLCGVLLGAWAHGPTWRVDPDGTSHPEPPPAGGDDRDRPGGGGRRLCVLSSHAACDLFVLLTQATPGGRHPSGPGRPEVNGDRPLSPVAVPAAAMSPAGPPAAAATPGRLPAAGAVGGAGPAAAAAPLGLRLLGGVDLYPAGQPEAPVRLGRSAAVQVLVFLAVYPGGVGSAELAAAIWPGVRPRPVGRLYTAASALRTAVARATGADILARAGDRYRLNPTVLRVDLWELTAAVDTAAAADPHARTAALHRVIDLYRGEVAAGHPWPWIAPLREAVRRRVIDAYTTLAGDGDADPPTAAGLLCDALAVDPVNEHLHRHAARALAAAGQPAQASAVLAQLTARLAEFGEHPDPRTRALAEQLAGHHRTDRP